MTRNHWLLSWLIIGLILRVIVWMQFDQTIYLENRYGGDSVWYLAQGVGFFSGQEFGTAYGIRYSTSNTAIPPLYSIFTGIPHLFFENSIAIYLIQAMQILANLATCYMAYRIAQLIFNERAGWIAIIALAISPALVNESIVIGTETLYLFFITAGMWLYCEKLAPQNEQANWQNAFLIGCVFALATLTRAASLLYPVGVAGLLILSFGRTAWRQSIQLALILLIGYGAVISTWTIHNWLSYDRFIIVSNQFTPAVWRGAVTEDGSPAQNDALLGNNTHEDQVAEIILSDPLAYLKLRAQELTGAVLEPHGLIGIGDGQLRQQFSDWINSGLSMQGLWTILSSDGFALKVLIYVWHYGSIVGCVIGAWITRHQWRYTGILLGFIIYTLLLHSVVLAIPRYIFPISIALWILASGAYATLWQRLQKNRVADELPYLQSKSG